MPTCISETEATVSEYAGLLIAFRRVDVIRELDWTAISDRFKARSISDDDCVAATRRAIEILHLAVAGEPFRGLIEEGRIGDGLDDPFLDYSRAALSHLHTVLDVCAGEPSNQLPCRGREGIDRQISLTIDRLKRLAEAMPADYSHRKPVEGESLIESARLLYEARVRVGVVRDACNSLVVEYREGYFKLRGRKEVPSEVSPILSDLCDWRKFPSLRLNKPDNPEQAIAKLQSLVAGQLRQLVELTEGLFSERTDVLPAGGETSQPASETETLRPVQYVTLDSMAAIVQRSKRTLENRRDRRTNPLPSPDVEGGGGKPHEWIWTKIRPWLTSEFGKQLPVVFPSQTDIFQPSEANRN
jgi:hypothetical protein